MRARMQLMRLGLVEGEIMDSVPSSSPSSTALFARLWMLGSIGKVVREGVWDVCARVGDVGCCDNNKITRLGFRR